jgi:6-pyruvoyltetrahydropterin/6-carboxytetrahydropterin synthase
MDLVLLNRLAAEVCLELHNKVLIPGRSDEFSGSENEGQIQVESHGRRFVLPAENCAVLPVSNTTAEMLAWHILERLLPRLEAQSALSDVRVIQAAVEEADRQWGLCRRELGVGGRPAHG